ncbi:type II and III secretion system protein [bacterium]|nr:type II and III secretion system protein [bacterium]
MSTLATALIFKSALLISPSNPLELSSNHPTLWFSKSGIVKLRERSQGNLIEVLKPGSVHIFGLGHTKNTQKIVALDDQDYAALKKCPKSPIEIEENGLYWKSGNIEDLHQEKCNFKTLHLKDPKLMTQSFALAERNVYNLGYKIQKATFKDGRRHLSVAHSKDKAFDLKKFSNALGSMRAFYSVEMKSTPAPGNTMLFELTLFEFSRDRAEKLGLRWPTEFNIKALEGGVATFNGPANVDLVADFGQSQGVGKILARPQLRATPGEKAKFQSGGELPIRQASLYSQKTQWKSYGLILELTVSGDTRAGDQEVDVAFNLELSEPDPSTAVDGVPGMIKRSLESRFELNVGETTVLSSLQKTREGKNRTGLFGLSSIPLLGRLFSENSYQDNQSELWFAIKPQWSEIKSPYVESESYELEF